MKLRLQITTPTMPAIAALLMIVVLLTGTTATAIVPAALATTETVSIENITDTEVTTQDNEAIADVETQQSSTAGEVVGQESPPSSTGNQSEPTTILPSANNTTATTAVNATSNDNTTNTTDIGLNGSIVFARSQLSDMPDTAEIYVMNADGSGGQTGLTDNDVADFDPTWSPDGTKIAFASERDGSWPGDNSEIYVMNADGSGLTRLTNNDGYDASPSWSPDGEKIAFVSERAFQDTPQDYKNREIYVMNVDDGTPPPPASRPQQIIEEAISTIENLDNISQGLRTSIVVLLRQVLGIINDDAPDGTGTVTPPSQEPIRLTNNNASDESPSWSPDGEKIAFSSDRVGGPFSSNVDIYVMNADDGSEQTRLTEESQYDISPRWSPDGEKIAFESGRGVGRGIYVMNADDGSNVTRLTEGEGPAWSPDGEKIAFTSYRDAEVDSDKNAIYVMNSTGAGSSNATRLTEPDWYYENLDWSGSASTPGGGSNATNNTGGGGANNQTGNQTGGVGGAGNTTDPLRVDAIIGDIDQGENPVVVLETEIEGGIPPYTCQWDLGDGTIIDNCGVPSYIYREPGEYTATLTVTDATGQTASDNTGGMGVTNPSGNQIIGGTNTEGIPSNIHPPVIYPMDDETAQATSPEGASNTFTEVRALEYFAGDIRRVPVSCDHESGETFPIGETVVTCTAIGTEVEPGQRYTTQDSFTITVVEELPAVADGEITEPPTDTVEVPQAADDGEEAELPTADGGEEAETPTNSTGGQ